MRIETIVPEYLAHLNVERSCSPGTLEVYQGELKFLCAYLEGTVGHTYVEQLATPVLRGYIY